MTDSSATDGPPTYGERAPPPALAPWVQCFWRIRGVAADATPNRVLPDGCADVIVDLSAAPFAFAVGPMRTASVAASAALSESGNCSFAKLTTRMLLAVATIAVVDRVIDHVGSGLLASASGSRLGL